MWSVQTHVKSYVRLYWYAYYAVLWIVNAMRQTFGKLLWHNMPHRGIQFWLSLCENVCQIRRLVTLTDVAELAAAVFGIASGAFWIPSLHFFCAGPKLSRENRKVPNGKKKSNWVVGKTLINRRKFTETDTSLKKIATQSKTLQST